MFRHLVLLVCFVATGAGCDLFPETPPDAQLPSGGSGGAGGTGGTGGVGGSSVGGTAGDGGTAGTSGTGGVGGQGGTAGTGGQGGTAGTGGTGGVGGTAGNAGMGGTGAGGSSGSGAGGGPAGGGGAGGTAGSAGAGGTTIFKTIENGDDDVNEDSNGYYGTATTVWIGTADDTVHSFTGLRFRGVKVPAGAEILDAWIEIYATTGQSQSIDVSMAADLDANCKLFTSGQPPGKRTPTTVSSDFTTSTPWQAGVYNRVGSVKAPLKEVFGLPGWASDNAVCIIIKGIGTPFSRRYGVSYEGSSGSEAPKLVVRYSMP